MWKVLLRMHRGCFLYRKCCRFLPASLWRLSPCVVCLALSNIFLLLTLHTILWPPYQENTQDYAPVPVYSRRGNYNLTQAVPQPHTFSNDISDSDGLSLNFKPQNAQLVGIPRDKKGFLTIGIPTINRHQKEAEYLKETINSLFTKVSEDDQECITILIYVADFNKRFQSNIIKYFSENYPAELVSGKILILLANENEYPRLDGLKRNYNDSEERVKWRSKQVVDYAFMFYYGQNFSQYYLQLEDDVIAAKDYVRKIREYIEEQRKPWVTLQFSMLGFIGKLYRSSDLSLLYNFLMLFYDQMPVDWLYKHFASAMAKPDMPLRKPTLFQHKGRHSSLQAKQEVKLKDGYFEEDLVPKARGDNPKADICTTIEQFGEFKPSYAYNATWPIHFFWGTKPKRDDHFSLQFEKPQRITEVEVISGHRQKMTDIITEAVLELGYMNYPRSQRLKKCACNSYKMYSRFSDGHSIISDRVSYFDNPVSCIRILFKKTQMNWVIIYNVIIRTVQLQ